MIIHRYMRRSELRKIISGRANLAPKLMDSNPGFIIADISNHMVVPPLTAPRKYLAAPSIFRGGQPDIELFR
jgi:hypothetical protein